MADIGGFVKEVLGVGVVVSSLLGIAAFLGRSQIAHWLNKDIERIKSEYQQELESQKAAHMRDLEAYKVSLIAEAERAKAAQAVKTAVAVKFSEHQFTAISGLNDTYHGMTILMIQMLDYPATHRDLLSIGMRDEYHEDFSKLASELDSKRDAYTVASYAAKVWLSDDDNSTLNVFNALLSRAASEAYKLMENSFKKDAHTAKRDSQTALEHFQIQLLSAEHDVSKLLRDHAQKFKSMSAS